MSANTKSEIVTIINKNGEALRSFGVGRIALFGSFVRDEATLGSDVDLLVEFEPGQKSFINFANLGFFLEEVLGRKVELVTRESLSPHAGAEILEEIEYIAEFGRFANA